MARRSFFRTAVFIGAADAPGAFEKPARGACASVLYAHSCIWSSARQVARFRPASVSLV